MIVALFPFKFFPAGIGAGTENLGSPIRMGETAQFVNLAETDMTTLDLGYMGQPFVII